MNWRLGTIGFGYSEWAGTFYPRGMKAGDYLAHYAQYFDSVELDTTFHATPPPERFRRWAEMTPAGFRFCVKTPRAVTHGVTPDRAIDPMKEFLDATTGGLGQKLGVVVIQFPPHFEIDQFAALETFLKALPRDVRFAVELRNRTWGEQRTLDLLREHRCCLVAAEYLSRPARLHVTTDFLFIRCIGEHQRFAELNREQADVTESLTWWKQQIDAAADQVSATWAFFNNDFSGYAVATCNRFKALVGEAVKEPPAIPGGLFP
jgi:uncharacterized protein YecE (DUF72 family)